MTRIRFVRSAAGQPPSQPGAPGSREVLAVAALTLLPGPRPAAGGPGRSGDVPDIPAPPALPRARPRVTVIVVSEDRQAQRIVVVGAGMAGVQTAVSLREQGYRGEITLLGAEEHQPYDRPPLSKAVLLGAADGSAFEVDFAGLGVELLLGRRAEELRPDRGELRTSAGPVPYDRLVIATGAEALTLPGAESVPGVHLPASA